MDFQDIVTGIFSHYLTLEDISRLDVAICDKEKRLLFLSILRECILNLKKDQYYKKGSIIYMSLRGVKIRHLLNSDEKDTYSDDEVLKIADFGNALESLRLYPSHISSSTIVAVIESCRNLQELKFSHGKSITDDIVFKIGECSHSLLNLDFGESLQQNYNVHVNESSWKILALNCPLLQSLNLNSTSVTDASIKIILASCHQLKSLSLCNCGMITDCAFVKFIAYNLSGKKVDFSGNNWGYLTDGCKVSDLTEVTQFTKETFNKILYCCFQMQHHRNSKDPMHILDNDLFVEIQNLDLPNLTHLDLSQCGRLTDLSLLLISSGCPNLQNLNLCCTKIKDGFTNFNIGSFYKLAEGCPKIRVLDLSYCYLVPVASVAKVLELCQELEELILCGCSHLPLGIMGAIAMSGKALKHFNLRGCSFNNYNDLSILLQHCPNITKLTVCKFEGDFELEVMFPLVTFIIDDDDSESESDINGFSDESDD
jgi:hypothetical protein